ncbi:lytic transglycosylase domain-containing protein [Actinoplanes sp. NPDC026619]|uniref:aggregation-promoting factor C-terminal-like domain-containing protein n=1 Tax=Actinoplanes sp. NPDC026619 TaxID=3155798 RepID=UPI0033F4FD69
MNRPWSRIGVRSASLALLLAGVAGGVYLGKGHEAQQFSAHDAALEVAQVDADDMQLLKLRQREHVAARAYQRQAEGDAAEKAAAEARTAATKAHTLNTKMVEAKKAEEARKKAEAGGPVAYAGPIPASCNEYSGSRQIGCALMLDSGFGLDQFPCLDKLFKKESGWNYRAENRSSGAYGIPQALPGKKMASAGADWKTNPATQIKWGLGYIEGRYDTPCKAWAHSESVGSY